MLDLLAGDTKEPSEEADWLCPPLARKQVKRLVAVNPWLAGRLRRAENGHTVLWIPDKPNADDCFRVAEDNKLELGQVSKCGDEHESSVALPHDG